MGNMTVSVGSPASTHQAAGDQKGQLLDSISRLDNWLETHDYKGYDTFDGLSSYLRALTFETSLLRTVLQQGVRRFPLNLRPILGIPPCHSSKGMGFLARGYMRLHDVTGDPKWKAKVDMALHWLIENQSKGYSGACWGNHFDYQSRSFYLPKGVPTVVWTSLIGHAFLDAYDRYGTQEYLDLVVSACHHILKDLGTMPDGGGVCISYIPGMSKPVHNASTLGASLLARTFQITGDSAYRNLAEQAIRYTAHYQRADASWYYGEPSILHWVDNFHTAYVLDCFKYYSDSTGDKQFDRKMMAGYEYWKKVFFLEDGTPRYYDRKTLPLDIQCSSQAIDTLVFFQDRDPEALTLAMKVASWTIQNMQDPTGYFYYRRYNSWVVNKTPTLHWGQATMLCALTGLYKSL